MDASTYPARKLPYRYVFESHELDEIRKCNDEHGFAVVKQMIPAEYVARLKRSVSETLAGKATVSGSTAVSTNFIEVSADLADILTYEPYLRVAHAIYDDRELVLNRSAAIYKNPGAEVHTWHTDCDPLDQPYGCNAVLNNTGACSNWFYLNGTHPDRGGLAIIPDSHGADWAGPEGFEFTPGRRSFYRKGTRLTKKMLPLL